MAKDDAEAARWFRKAASQNFAAAQYNLGDCYYDGRGLAQDEGEAAKWFRKAADRNYGPAQYNLGLCYYQGQGVPKDDVEALKWFLLAALRGSEDGKTGVARLESELTEDQLKKGQKLARRFKPTDPPGPGSDRSFLSAQARPEPTSTGFFITEDGYLITSEQVTGNGPLARIVTATGILSAKVVKLDAVNGLALLKAEGTFAALPLASNTTLTAGSAVSTVGFPTLGIQGFAPQSARGRIEAISGAPDDATCLRLSVPVQPGNWGGPLMDEHGNVIGMVCSASNRDAPGAAGGGPPEVPGYGVKGACLRVFLESEPGVSSRLKPANTGEHKFEDIVQSASKAAVLVLAY